MTFRYIDMDSFPRKAHFDYFSGLENPYVGITAEVDITGFPEACKEKGYPFFLTFLYCAANAANTQTGRQQSAAHLGEVFHQGREDPHPRYHSGKSRPGGRHPHCPLLSDFG